MTDTTTPHMLEVSGTTLAWDLRRNDQSTMPVLLMVGYPMGATGFTSQANHFGDRTVVTYDPRGVERSANGVSGLPVVEQNVEDLHQLIETVRAQVTDEPVDIFASSGGAVNALALVAAYPDDVATLVAHEPPTLAVLQDADAAAAAWLAVRDTYARSGWGAGMAHFIAMTSHDGPYPDGWADQTAPDPALFGMPSEDDGSRDDPLLSQDESGVPNHRLDVDAIAAASTRVVIAAGAATGNALTARTSAGLAEMLGTDLVAFPGDHGGFMGGEYGQPAGVPDAFATRLRQTLDDPATV